MNNPRWEASTYDRVSNPHARWGADVVQRLRLRGTETVLDAGCGSGRVTETLFPLLPQGHVIALDASSEMLAQASKRLERFGGRVTLVRADVLEPPTLGAVDAIFSNAAFHWISDHRRLFASLAGVLQPGGQLVAQYGGTGNVARVLAVAAEIEPRWRAPWTFHGPQETRSLLEAAGFVEIEAWLNEAPTVFGDLDQLATFLATVLFAPARDYLDAAEHRLFAEAVAARLPARELDYVRLNVIARLE